MRARELPWPESSADLWRFAAGSPTKVPSPRCSLRRLASLDGVPELPRAWLGPPVAAPPATACLLFVAGPDPVAPGMV